MAPKRFGKYEVLARIATGGAANIFLARQPGAADFHKLVCLKTLLPERASDADFVAMFLDEARLAARLNHPNCVQIFDLGRVKGSYYISMEYIFGETLWNLLATVTKLRTPLPAPHVASIISSVCDGLHHAHELKDSNGRMYNLVHRDVSPQNVMITFEGQTKVVDFGIAKAETGRVPTMAGIVKGKFSYMSPEQITGGTIDRRSDVYSLGIVLFECLASRRLYRGETPEEIARLILEHRAPRLRDVVPDIPPALDNICAIALARHPSKRFQTAHAMGEALRDFLDSIRYAQSAAAIARLIEQRFEGQIGDRRKVFESALAGSYDEQHLLKILDARAVRDIDLFPDDEYPEEREPDMVEPVSEPASPPVSSSVSEPAPLSSLTDRRDDDEEDAADQATQFEPDEDEDEDALYAAGESTRVDADAEERFEEEMVAPKVPTDSTTTVEQSSISRNPLITLPPTKPNPALDFGDATELRRDGKIDHLDADTGPFDQNPPLLPRKVPIRARRGGSAISTSGVVPARGSGSARSKSATNGADPASTTARLSSTRAEEDHQIEPRTLTTDVTDDGFEDITKRPVGPSPSPPPDRPTPYVPGPILVRPHTNDMVPQPIDPHEPLVSTHVNQASYDGIAVRESESGHWADPTDGPLSPSSKRDDTKSLPKPVIDEQKTPPQFPQPVAPAPVPVQPVTRTEIDPSARFGTMALVAALALGVAIGLVLGLVLARLVYAPVTIPVPVRLDPPVSGAPRTAAGLNGDEPGRSSRPAETRSDTHSDTN